jgi:hypothetical protein
MIIEACQKREPSCSLFTHDLYSNANVAHAYALCWAWDKYISTETGPIAILDSDVFLIEPINLTEILNGHHICYVQDGKPHQDGRVFHYMWPTFSLMNMDRLPEPSTLCWWCGRIEDVPVDVAGQTYHYFQTHPELDTYIIPRKYSHWLEADGITCPEPCNFTPTDYDEFYLEGKTVLHYRSGSNWNGKSPEYHAIKTAWLKRRMGISE